MNCFRQGSRPVSPTFFHELEMKKSKGTQVHIRKRYGFMPVCGHPNASKFTTKIEEVTCGNCKQGEQNLTHPLSELALPNHELPPEFLAIIDSIPAGPNP